MNGPVPIAARRYVAFISYSHVDRDIARWLHRSIESYRLPPRLRTPLAASGMESGRLTPVFLDREDLPSSTDLAESVRLALDNSDALIVVCSPIAARSRWVNEEVRRFKELGRETRESFAWSSPANLAQRTKACQRTRNACLRPCGSSSKTASSRIGRHRNRWPPTCALAPTRAVTPSSRSSRGC